MKNKYFKDRVVSVVRNIPKGKTMSYLEVAKKANSNGASRAVGTIMAKNKDKDIPCHRVIKSNKHVGEYNGGGIKAKIKRLESEGVTIVKNKVVS